MIDSHLVWTAFFAPLVSCVLITLLFLRSKTSSFLVAVGGILTSFVCSCLVFAQIFQTNPPAQLQQSLTWIRIDTLTINFGFLINPLAIMMLLIVTGVGSAIFIYSRGYMNEDPGSPRFFAELSLFAFSMIGIVLSNNFIQLFIFWELVGLSSYLLIGFWYTKPSAADAGVKAFLVNRLSDFGFLCGIILLWSVSDISHGHTLMPSMPVGRSFQFTELAKIVPFLDPHMVTVIGLLLFCGVIGKSAQVPLHVWLIDAMEGPTPVSALIHAATMVAAGIYLLARTFFIFEPSVTALTVIGYTGAITSLMAAILAIAENDIKKILAYSTLSQLGLMVLALGLGGPVQGMYHLTTHAFFKALLFLGAGSVICALHHEQNIWNMHGLFKKMPITGITFLIGALALSGIFPLSGFWSKDAILGLAFEHNTVLYLIAAIASGLTAFYMGRLFWVVFWGNPSDDHHGQQNHEILESPAVMTIPLIFLAILSAIGGFIGIPHFLSPQEAPEMLNMRVALISSVVAIAGIVFSYMIYGKRTAVDPLTTKLGSFYTVLRNKFYFDIVYGWYVDNIQQNAALFLSWFEKEFIVRLCVGGLTNMARSGGKTLRYLQNGLVQSYALVFVLGAVLIFLFLMVRI